MTDYFALLGVSRRPWIDDEELKAKYHSQTLKLHPDAPPENGDGSTFTSINEGYQTLRDPKRRLQHLLILENFAGDRNSATIPPRIQELFPRVSDTTQRSEAALVRARAASSDLARSLLKPEVLRSQSDVGQLLQTLTQLNQEALGELEDLDKAWSNPDVDIATAHRLQLTFSYLGRWIAQLEEKRFQLSLC